MSTNPNYSLEWILPMVRESLRDVGGFHFNRYADSVCAVLAKRGVAGVYKREPTAGGNNVYDWARIPHKLRDTITESFFFLVHGGFVVPPAPELHFATSQEHILSPRGEAWVRSADPVPEDHDGYLNFLRTLVPTLDTVIAQYVSEGLSSFVRQSYFAAAVMIGAGSEKAIYLLADSMLPALRKPADRTKLTDLLGRRSLKALFDFLTKKITDASVQKIIPYAVGEDAETHLMSLFAAIRIQRNDAVHPMNAQVSAEAVRLSFSAFPHALEKTQDLRDWFDKNPGTI